MNRDKSSSQASSDRLRCDNIPSRQTPPKSIEDTDLSGINILSFSNYRPQSEGDNVLGSVRPSVRLSGSALTAEPFDLRVIISPRCLSVCRANAVDLLLINIVC